MRRIGAVAAMLMVAGCSAGPALPAADQAVERFRKQYEARQFAEIYREAAPEFRLGTPEADLVKQMSQWREGLGSFRSAPPSGWRLRDGGRVLHLVFDSTFEKGKAMEKFAFKVDGSKVALLEYEVEAAGAPAQ
ncbi:hypothetical protein ACFQ1E_09415 [Sphingomonas canadensis]|uniref:DUF4019 domain-containing protein n=1 Tax=Sphingomonas canadensis TaxID=1219257 RepID=A0ABW3HB79_9SPHN|nr:hypothetical protein [Sphingomonas canadensis]MCW3836259.1 hypothetical protein [Sphingomonas canadensis]